MAALLGASPGASTAVVIMLEVLERCFPEQVDGDWGPKLREIFPSYGRPLNEDPELCATVRQQSLQRLGLAE